MGSGEARRAYATEPSSGDFSARFSRKEKGTSTSCRCMASWRSAEQHAALAPAAAGTRRVVLATNVAESSLTLPGVRAVVDLGLAREPRFDPNSGFTRLETMAIAQASADQRAGRAGRLGPGNAATGCGRKAVASKPSAAPEIAQVELSQLALELAAWGSDALRWLDAPPSGALAQARDLLRRLGALDDGRAHHRARPTHADARRAAAPRRRGAARRSGAARAGLRCRRAGRGAQSAARRIRAQRRFPRARRRAAGVARA